MMQRGNQPNPNRGRTYAEAASEKIRNSGAPRPAIRAGGWREIGCLKAKAGNLSLVQEGEQRRRADPRRADQFEWSIGPAPDAHIGALDHRNARIQRRISKRSQVRR